MSKRLYVGNLGFNVSAGDLESLFRGHGTVISTHIVTDRDTGQSKGFGFVEMGSEREAEAAIGALNGAPHEGRALTVNVAKPRPEKRYPPGFGGR